MLRSLVGSEMCIRDRDVRAVRWAITFNLVFAWVLTIPAAGLIAALFWYCLLYTSDAADDLLCVDLGGRRIIKKKKTRPYTRTSQH